MLLSSNGISGPNWSTFSQSSATKRSKRSGWHVTGSVEIDTSAAASPPRTSPLKSAALGLAGLGERPSSSAINAAMTTAETA